MIVCTNSDPCVRGRPSPGIDCTARNIVLLDELAAIVRKLARHRVRVVVFKGMGLLLAAYRDLSRRTMVDVDLLVASEDLEDVKLEFLGQGFAPSLSGQHVFVRRRGRFDIRFDIHTGLEYLSADRTRDLVSRCEEVNLRGVSVWIPAPEDHLLLIAVHAVVGHGQLRSGWLEDMRCVILQGVDWPTVVERAREVHMETPLELALVGCAKLDRALVPRETLSRLRRPAGNRWKRRVLARLLAGPEIPDVGHLLHFLLLRRWRERGAAIRRQFWPGRDFLQQRYGRRRCPRLGRPAWTFGRTLRLLYRLSHSHAGALGGVRGHGGSGEK